jgi:hypothetical protein
MVNKSNIQSRYSFDTIVAKLSQGGFYLAGYIEKPREESYSIYARVTFSGNGYAGKIHRSGLIEIVDGNDKQGRKKYRASLIEALKHTRKRNINNKKPTRKLNKNMANFPEVYDEDEY